MISHYYQCNNIKSVMMAKDQLQNVKDVLFRMEMLNNIEFI